MGTGRAGLALRNLTSDDGPIKRSPAVAIVRRSPITNLETAERAKPRHNATTTTFASVSSPFWSVLSQVSNDSTIGTVTQIATISVPMNRRMLTRRVYHACSKLLVWRLHAPVAQGIEHPPPKRGAASSILAGRANFRS